MENVDLDAWKKKRKVTIRVFMYQSFLLGMEYSLTFLTLWIYITTLVKTNKPKLFYGLISSAYLLTTVIFSIVIGRWVDSTRNIRLTFLVCNNFVIVGNLIYVIHHSPWFLVVGRFLAGIGSTLRSVISGEIARCFPSDQQLGKFSANGMAVAMGFIIGPIVNFIFKDVDIEFSFLRLTFANAPGFYMAGLFLLAQFFVMFAVHNLSKEYDLKVCETIQENSKKCTGKFFEQRDEDVTEFFFDESQNSAMTTSLHKTSKPEVSEKGVEDHYSPDILDYSEMEDHEPLLQTSTTKVSNIVLQNIKNFDVVIVFFLSFGTMFWIVLFDMWLPMMVIDVLNMSVTWLIIIVFSYGCVFVVVLLVFACKRFSDKALYKWSLVCVLSLALMQAIFAHMKMFPNSLYINRTFWVIWITLFAIVSIIEPVFFVGLLAKMTSSSIQTFNESLRLSMSRTGSLLALLTAAMLFEYVEYICLAGILFSLLTFVLLLMRRKTLQHPQLTIM